MRATVVVVDTEQLRENFRQVRQRVAPARVLAIVKANAYGHGLVECAEIFRQEGAAMLGVAYVQEGIQLRQAGNPLPILVLTPPQEDEAALYCRFRLQALACSMSVVERIAAAARQQGVRVGVHVAVDTGMRREGIEPSAALEFLQRLSALEGIEVLGLCTHFATADEPDPSFFWEQWRQFREVVQQVEAAGYQIPYIHAANSAAALRFPEARWTMVRPGIALYGYQPWDIGGRLPLRPALRWKSRVVAVRRIAPGDGVSYHRLYRAQRSTTIVTVPVGYADGYRYGLTSRAECLIHGKRFPVVGAVCMDEVMVDVGDEPVAIGEEVVLIGEQGGEAIWADEMACWLRSIPYEVLVGISPRVPRLYTTAESAHGQPHLQSSVAGV
ncbi:MAG: alanine racemase [Candidatus Kapabacteria bacterium]|nr:alanine racemase [Candidatus Kapabacteria bacterium]MDW8012857.1 alanine racemase [Bacteroidota bacterium]